MFEYHAEQFDGAYGAILAECQRLQMPEAYRTDLIHDQKAIAKLPEGVARFGWIVRKWGTHFLEPVEWYLAEGMRGNAAAEKWRDGGGAMLRYFIERAARGSGLDCRYFLVQQLAGGTVRATELTAEKLRAALGTLPKYFRNSAIQY